MSCTERLLVLETGQRFASILEESKNPIWSPAIWYLTRRTLILAPVNCCVIRNDSDVGRRIQNDRAYFTSTTVMEAIPDHYVQDVQSGQIEYEAQF